MAGFPPLDSVLYESPPGAKIISWIGFALTRIYGSNTADLTPGSLHSTTPVTPFDSLIDLLNHVRAGHADGIYYRGQTRRYTATYSGQLASLAHLGPQFRQVNVTFESMMPRLFRPVYDTAKSCWDWHAFAGPKLLDQFAPMLRAIFDCDYEPVRALTVQFMVDEIPRLIVTNSDVGRIRALLNPPVKGGSTRPLPSPPRQGGSTRPLPSPPLQGGSTRPLPSPTFQRENTGNQGGMDIPGYITAFSVSPILLQLISSAQHYEFGSIMVDVTRDPDVAAWFATHRSDGEIEKGMPGDEGVIYRFNINAIRDLVGCELMQNAGVGNALDAAGFMGLADISEFGEELGFRPRRQAGASLLGLENSILYWLLDAYSHSTDDVVDDIALRVYTFPLDKIDGAETKFTKDVLCPPNDPMAAVFREGHKTKTHRLEIDEIVRFLQDERVGKRTIKAVVDGRREGLI